MPPLDDGAVSADLDAAINAAWASDEAAGGAPDAPAAEPAAPAGKADPLAWEESTGWQREVWDALPAQARVHAREVAQARRAAEERAAAWQPFDEIIGPRRDALKATYGSEAAAVRELFALSDYAGRDFPGFVRWLAQSRGVDLRTVLGDAPAAAAGDPAAPEAAPPAQGERPRGADGRFTTTDIAREVNRALTEREVDTAFRDFEANAALEFRADPAVRRIMAGMLQSGAARTYADAYEMAVKAHPATAAKLAEKQAAAAREEAARSAAAKASAAASVRGAPGTARAPVARSASDNLEADIALAWDAHAGGRV